MNERIYVLEKRVVNVVTADVVVDVVLSVNVRASGGSRICQRGGRTMVSTQRQLIIGVWGSEPPAGSKVSEPQKMKAFCPFSFKGGAKS